MKSWHILMLLSAITVVAGYYFYIKKQSEVNANYSSPPPYEFQCSGKVYCSQMTSCKEALFYQKNCPGTKMDGDGDNIPCEEQWCGHSISAAHHFN